MSASPATNLASSVYVPRPESLHSLTYLAIVAADLVAFCLAWSVSSLVRFELAGRFGPIIYLSFFPTLAVFGFVFALAGLYPGIALNPIDEFRRMLRTVSLGSLVAVGLVCILHKALLASTVISFCGMVLTLALIFSARHLVRSQCSRRPWWGIPTVIIGEQGSAQAALNLLHLHPPLGLRPVAILYDSADPACGHRRGSDCEQSVFSGCLADSSRVALQYPGCYAILSLPFGGASQLGSVLIDHASVFGRVLVIPEMFGVTSLLVTAKDICGVLALEVDQQLTRLVPQILKRTFDLTLCIAGGTVLSPLILLICLLTRLSSPGPIFYGHNRIGRGGKRFKVWKFRSMVQDAENVLQAHLHHNEELRAEWNLAQKLQKDPRVTTLGRYLRKTSLDELPQLWNVVCGEMSLVGPRPIINSEIERYGAHFRQYCRVTPGITGLWQISGRNKTTYELRTQLDAYYVRNWSVTVDLYILLHTLKTVLLTEGAY